MTASRLLRNAMFISIRGTEPNRSSSISGARMKLCNSYAYSSYTPLINNCVSSTKSFPDGSQQYDRSQNVSVVFCRQFSSTSRKNNAQQAENIDMSSFPVSKIRNFSIIAHVDHGKSTLADRLLELTGTISKRADNKQVLDKLQVEKERGITVKAQTASMIYEHGGERYLLNLIDTPGHVDFNYEVSRSLAACQGVILVVDANQGVQAQTVANFYLAFESNLHIIPVINKIDLKNADPEAVTKQIESLFDIPPEDILRISAKHGTGVDRVLSSVIEQIPSPPSDRLQPLRALLFDSVYDRYKGAIVNLALRDGRLTKGDRIQSAFSEKMYDVQEVGIMYPDRMATKELLAGQVGYVVAGMHNIREAMIGDTFYKPGNEVEPFPGFRAAKPMCVGNHIMALLQVLKDYESTQIRLAGQVGYVVAGMHNIREAMIGDTFYKPGNEVEPFPGFKAAKPMVFAGVYPIDQSEFPSLRSAIDRLTLNDSSVTVSRDSSPALGQGFRLGFLGLLHMDVFNQRLEQEHNANVIITVPSVPFRARLKATKANLKAHGDDLEVFIQNPAHFPEPQQADCFLEPMVLGTIITPDQYLRNVINLCTRKRGEQESLSYVDSSRVYLKYKLPLNEVVVDFFDELKSLSSGYASFDYEDNGYEEADLLKLRILLNGKEVEELATIVHRAKAVEVGKSVCAKLQESIPRQLYEVAIQAAIGGKIVARESVRALRKNVLAKCYGGDMSRKMKLLKRQAEGKKKMKKFGNVEVPKEAFLSVLKR